MLLHPADTFDYFRYLFLPKRTLVLMLLFSQKQLALTVQRQKQNRQRIRPSYRDRLQLTLMARAMGNAAFMMLRIVQPDTLKRWLHEFATYLHTLRSLFGRLRAKYLQWRGIIKKNGRPRIDKSIRAHVLKIARENPFLGVMKIRGVLWKLGICVSAESIRKILRKYFPRHDGRRRTPDDHSITWSQFFFALKEGLHAMDMFSVFSMFGRQIFGLFLIDHSNRRVFHCAFSARPNPSWVYAEVRRAYVNYPIPELLIMDNDGNFSPWFERKIKETLNIKTHRITPQSPWENAVAERVIQTFRKECFDRLPPVLGCAHAERLMKPYLEYYNHHRPHDTLNFHSPENDVFEPYRKCARTLTSIPIFHGLWNHYQWAQG